MVPVLLLMLATGCATAVSEACPHEVEYSAKTQDRIADELDELERANLAPTIRTLVMPDYGRLRDQSRACRGKSK